MKPMRYFFLHLNQMEIQPSQVGLYQSDFLQMTYPFHVMFQLVAVIGHSIFEVYRVQSLNPGIESTSALIDSDSLMSYVLTFWARGKGLASIIGTDSTGGWINRTVVNASSWTFFADTLLRHQLKYNTLEVWLYAPTDDSLSSIYFDNIKVVKKKL